MPDLYSSTDDGAVYSFPNGSWAAVRDDDSGTVAATSNTSYSSFTSVSKFNSRGGGNTFRVIRSFMWFDTSGISATVGSATIKIRGYSTNNASVIPVKSTAFGGDGGTALAAGDIDAITGFSSGASLAGNATTYGPAILSGSWSNGAYNDFTGTSDLLADMKNNDAVIICFMDYTNDYLNSTPSTVETVQCGAFYTDTANQTHDPYITYTLSTGYTHNVLGVAAASISEINSTSIANVGKVIGV